RLFHPDGAGLHSCLNMVAGGGGGSSVVAGEVGRVQSSNSPDPITGVVPWLACFGPATLPASAVQLLPYPSTGASLVSSRHHLVGGVGGGGAASNTAFSFDVVTFPQWAPGGGGGGGGGAMALRSGLALRLAATGKVAAQGGSTPDITFALAAPRAMPGGGGACGWVVLQCAGDVLLFGLLQVPRGIGGISTHSFGVPPIGATLVSRAGEGDPGLVRLAPPAASAANLASSVQPSNATATVGELVEQDALVACQSLFYSTGLSLGPQYARYEITALVDGQLTLFSDDPMVSTMVAGPGAPLRAVFQAGAVDLQTGVVSDIKPWRSSVRSTANQGGIASDHQNAFRFRLIVDRMFAQTVVVQRVEVIYRN